MDNNTGFISQDGSIFLLLFMFFAVVYCIVFAITQSIIDAVKDYKLKKIRKKLKI